MPERHLNLLKTTLVGLGGIVGGGILALAGVALSYSGPSALLAFLLNSALAIITAMAFAEVATAFPQSGGTYAYAKRVLPVQSAFAVGWVVWFASVVAGALYALGFSAYALLALKSFAPDLGLPFADKIFAALAILLYTALQSRAGKGGGELETWGKMILFVVLIAGGGWQMLQLSGPQMAEGFRPFFSGGANGLFKAMGFTFIAFQGFDLIAAIAGEVKDPGRNLPRAMIGSLVIATAVYLPLLIVIACVGIPQGQSLSEFATQNPDTIVALSARQFMGQTGYWLVIVAAVLAMLSALQANLVAAASMAQSMALDRTLPDNFRSPRGALIASTALMLLLTITIPDVGTAGATASLVFLLSFALVHFCCLLARRRRGGTTPGFRIPGFPYVPRIAGYCCLALALFQGFNVPSAGVAVAAWLTIGGGLFLSLLAKRAGVMDAAQEARNPELVQLRGRAPLILVPVANPTSAPGMLAVARALSPPQAGRIVLLSVVESPQQIESAQKVLGQALERSLDNHDRPSLLFTLADKPWSEIHRVCVDHRCECLLLGFSGGQAHERLADLSALIRTVQCDVVVVRIGKEMDLSKFKTVLVPVAGKGKNDALRARFLNSLARDHEVDVTYLRLMPEEASDQEVHLAQHGLDRLVDDELCNRAKGVVERDSDFAGRLVRESANADITVLGLQAGDTVFSNLLLQVAEKTEKTLIVIGHYS